MKTIVIAVDGSEQSNRALEMGAQIAEKFDADLILAHVLLPLVVPAEASPAYVQEFDRQRRADAEALVRQGLDRVGSRKPRTELLVLSGSPAEELDALAVQRDADMVIIGSRGRGAVARALLGSVSNRLVHICQRPVLVVH